MTETATLEPAPSWLAEVQRERCAGGSPLATFQGQLVDEIVLPQSAADHADQTTLARAVDALADALLKQVQLIPGEFAPEILMSRYARDYVEIAKSVGHQRYLAARGGDDIAIKCAGAGLKSMIADPHLQIFNLVLRLKRAKPGMARKIAAQSGFRSVDAAFKAMDKRLIELEQKEPLAPRQRAWLNSLRKVKLVADAEMTPALVRFARTNPLFEQRRAESERVRIEREANDPAFQAARRLCEMAGLNFVGIEVIGETNMRAVWSEGPDKSAYQWRIETDRGARNALFYIEGGLFKRRLAVLLDEGAALPLGSLTLSSGEYEAVLNHRN
jgi:hypothetical protein